MPLNKSKSPSPRQTSEDSSMMVSLQSYKRKVYHESGQTHANPSDEREDKKDMDPEKVHRMHVKLQRDNGSTKSGSSEEYSSHSEKITRLIRRITLNCTSRQKVDSSEARTT